PRRSSLGQQVDGRSSCLKPSAPSPDPPPLSRKGRGEKPPHAASARHFCNKAPPAPLPASGASGATLLTTPAAVTTVEGLAHVLARDLRAGTRGTFGHLLRTHFA